MTDAQNSARLAFSAIRQALIDFGRPATAAEIAAKTGLGAALVTRRLQSNGTGNANPAFCWFTRGRDGTWGLTDRGRTLE